MNEAEAAAEAEGKEVPRSELAMVKPMVYPTGSIETTWKIPTRWL